MVRPQLDYLVRPPRRRRGRPPSIGALRFAELNRYFTWLYGAVWPDDDAARDDLFTIACHLARHPRDPAGRIREYARDVAPWLEQDELDRLVVTVTERPFRWTADKLAKRIGLTAAVRHELQIRTIGACDMTKAERIAQQRERRRAAQEQRRRAAGARTSAQYHAERRAKFNSCPV